MAKRSIAIAGHRTSISLEEPFWSALTEIASGRGLSVSGLVAEIDRDRPSKTNLSSAVRVFVLDWYRARPPTPRAESAVAARDRPGLAPAQPPGPLPVEQRPARAPPRGDWREAARSDRRRSARSCG